jgi:hypothetical protein
MSQKGLPSLLDRHWAESALAIGAVIIAAVSLLGGAGYRENQSRAGRLGVVALRAVLQ